MIPLMNAIKIAAACREGKGADFSTEALRAAAKLLDSNACSGSFEDVTEELLRRETSR